MRKILSGFLFRLLKGWEIWALIAILLIATVYLDYLFIYYDLGFYTKEQYEDIEERGYRFSELGISAHDAYWFHYAPVQKESFDKLSQSYAGAEPGIFIAALSNNVVFPAMLMMIFIPVFFGRMFSDGTIRNLVACGFSKVKIYLSTLMFACIVDVALYFIGLFAFSVLCAFARWSPPIYLPIVAPIILVLLLLLFTMSAVSLAALFISYSKIICAITGFILAFLMVSPVGNYSFYKVSESYEYDYEASCEARLTIREIDDGNGTAAKLDLSSMLIRTYYGDKELDIFKDSYLSTGERVTTLAVVYMDPYQAANRLWENNLPACLMVRDGFMAINAASNLFWISFFTYAGITFFKKREIHC